MRPRHVVLLISHAAEPRLPPATPLESTRRFARFWWDLTPFRINTSGSVHSKQLYLPLESTLMKRGGGGPVIVNQKYQNRFLRDLGVRRLPRPSRGISASSFSSPLRTFNFKLSTFNFLF